MTRCHRAVIGFLAAGALSLPLVASAVSAAPKKPAPKKPAPKAPAKGDAKLGKEAFKKEGCTGCHVTKDFPDAGKTGPDLSGIGAEHDAKFISGYIAKPKAGSIMPAYKGPAKTLADMTAYMLTQKG
jgi:cbb3-type cytochrome oxidase cytochrome c subunit